jgi:hypothetical protein
VNDRDEGAGFLSRWSRRKTAARAETVTEVPVPVTAATDEGIAAPAESDMADLAATPLPAPVGPAPLPDIETLASDGDFSPFMAKGVDAGTRNQAMKKLFTDPHYGFESMDKLDIYLDDYSKPDPIPLEMLRGLNQAKRLFLFEDEEKQEAAAARALHAPVVEAATSAPATPVLLPESSSEGESGSHPEIVIVESVQPK